MSPKRQKPNDPFEQAIETALAPGSYVSYNAAWSFTEDVQGVANDVGKLIKSDPARAVQIYETFIAACHEKADEIDDSSGSFGALVDDLFCGWIKARQAAGKDPDETVKSLLSWMEEDTYGFCYDLDKEAVKVLDGQGLDALARQIRGKFEATANLDSERKERSPGYAHSRWENALKTVLAAQGDIEGYITLCNETKLGAEDCKVIAGICRSSRRPDDALSWVERGLAIACSATETSLAGDDLAGMKRELLAELGRMGEALESAWAEFQGYPSIFRYKELMRYVPASERKAWHQKAMETSETGSLSSQIELWLDKREIGRLVARLHRATNEELENLSHYAAEPAARKIERPHPAVAARVYRALGMRIVNAGKSKYYDAALDHLDHAKKCYLKAGVEADWEALVADVRRRHHRKKGFMAGFEQILSGGPKHREPTFLERAKRRWPGGGKE